MRFSNKTRYPRRSAFLALFLGFFLAGLAFPARAQQDKVSIPKSRLEELEKKEAELEKLRNQLNREQPVPAGQAPVKAPKAPVHGQVPAPCPTPGIGSVPVKVAPALSTLPALGENEVVSAIDLANHYQQDRAAASQRYGKRSFAVQGEIERFEKRAFGRSYSLIMKTGGSNLKIICEVYPPEPFTAVFTAAHGSQMVGIFGENRKTLASADSVAVVRGECKGLEGSVITLKGCALKSVRPVSD